VKITVIAAALPPKLDGIGDYTARMCQEMARSAEIRILTAQPTPDPVPGVCIERVFSAEEPKSVRALLDAVVADPPDWILLQYNPFSYGKWGWNPYLPQTIRAIKKRLPRTRFALMAHETFVPIIRWQFAVMTVWQRAQLWSLGHSADLLFFSTEAWLKECGRWFAGKSLVHLPVCSNLPRVDGNRTAIRQKLGISDSTTVLGFFGTAHPSRMLGWVGQALQEMVSAGQDAVLLYIGPDGSAVADILSGLPVRDVGPLPGDAVSEHLCAVDIYLAPYVDGVTTRRGAFLAGLQHGLATVGTFAENTDACLRAHNGQAYLLCDARNVGEFCQSIHTLRNEAALRQQIALQGERYFEAEFAIERLASRLLKELCRQDAPHKQVA
jgi:glycosyltransferase involved in cell wall biosynthesis